MLGGIGVVKFDEEGIITGRYMEVCCWRMTPEDEARQLIYGLLKAAGWEIWDYKQLNPGASLGVIFYVPRFPAIIFK
jgi:hypothetical protein